ncbi:MAG: phosphoribosyltransferase [Acidimicrobiia bacterium]|nr:MAG: phosphoribosyltransferase [Acidimicrobiia bacterium]
MVMFRDREHAGELLGQLVNHRIDDVQNAIVLALPRGGVPVGAKVAQRLDLPLDVYLVRKLGVPGHREYAMGAIASGGVQVLNTSAIERLRITPKAVAETVQRELAELERREKAYRIGRPPLDLVGMAVILVDDGIATGSTMRAAIEAIRINKARTTTVAVPVAPRATVSAIERTVDRMVVLETPDPFYAVGSHYVDFTQTSEDEVRQLLAEAAQDNDLLRNTDN